MIVFRVGVPRGDRLTGLGIENVARFGFSPAGTVVVPPSFLNLTDTTKLKLPIDAALADQQGYKQGDGPIVTGKKDYIKLAEKWDDLPDFITRRR